MNPFQSANKYPFSIDEDKNPAAQGIVENRPANPAVCCLNIGHDFFPEATDNNGRTQLLIICRKCGEVRKID